MTKQKLERLIVLLGEFSASTETDEGGLRDDISWIIEAAERRLEQT